MRRRLVLALALAAVGPAALLAVACGDSAYKPGREPLDTTDDETDASTVRPRADTGADPDPPVVPLDGGASGRVLAHTSTQLFRLEPELRRLTLLGAFSCLTQGDQMIDIAVDRTGAVFGTSFTGFLTVDPLTAACTYIEKRTDYPNSLSFVPIGTVDSAKEALVGYAFDGPSATRYVRIDTATGAMTDLGTLNAPGAATEFVSSGDLVGLVNDQNRAYLTVRFKNLLADGGAAPDRLAEVSPATGRILRIVGDTKQRNLYGLGYWAGKGYGFADDGTVAEIDMKTGAGTPLSLSGITAKPRWFGAGVSTQAPGP